jgi:hypothetical protein
MKTVAKIYQCYPDSNVLSSFADRLAGRDIEKFMRQNNRQFIKEFVKNKYSSDNITVKWDRRLGCNCGCSPGFRVLTSNGKYYPDEFYTNGILQDTSGIISY